MSVFIATFIIIAIAIIAMAIGVIAGRPAIKGSCGGLNQIGLSGSCSGACSATEKQECARRKQNDNN
ncbi:MAG: (Na+)-NQR maturation NqrM [Gammaproteobacteria bacterium]|nr:(Na+)-NQR maturation NqrM [Gammaproteobacteria bacterium]MDT8371060.1 (Na+)-NQR maturation NqrM [Gammaproteobacteria bacterium]